MASFVRSSGRLQRSCSRSFFVVMLHLRGIFIQEKPQKTNGVTVVCLGLERIGNSSKFSKTWRFLTNLFRSFIQSCEASGRSSCLEREWIEAPSSWNGNIIFSFWYYLFLNSVWFSHFTSNSLWHSSKYLYPFHTEIVEMKLMIAERRKSFTSYCRTCLKLIIPKCGSRMKGSTHLF